MTITFLSKGFQLCTIIIIINLPWGLHRLLYKTSGALCFVLFYAFRSFRCDSLWAGVA